MAFAPVPRGTTFPARQPPTLDASGFVPYLHAHQNGFSVSAFSVIRMANLAVCILTALAMIGSAMESTEKR
jgi:hypothetical protein